MSEPELAFEKVEFTTKGKAINHLKRLSGRCRKLAKRIDRSVERSDKSITMLNFMNAAADFLEMGSAGINGHVSILALAARNLFELNIRLRDTLRDDVQLKRWHGEAIRDKVDFLQGFLKVRTASKNTEARQVLEAEVARLLALQEKYQLPAKGSPPTKNLAENVGLLAEYEAFFKVYSKLVHPTSFLVNDAKNTNNGDTKDILLMQLQLYAADTFHRVSEEFGFK